MQWFKDMKISTKLILNLILIGVLIITLGLVNRHYRNEIILNSDKLHQESQDILFINKKEIDHRKYMQKVNDMIVHKEMEDSILTKYTDCSFGQWYYDTINSEQLDKDEEAILLKDMEAPHKHVHEYSKNVYDLVGNGNTDEAWNEYEKASESAEELMGIFSRYEQHKEEENDILKQQSNKLVDKVNLISLIITAVALLVGILFSLLIISSIVKPLKKVLYVIGKLSKGDLTVNVEPDSNDEMGQLLNQLNLTTENLEKLIINIKNSSQTVSTASNEIAVGNQDLAQRTQEQASSLEETSSAIEELTATVKQNADNAQKANKMSEQTEAVVAAGNKVLKQTIGAMEEVNTSSKKISEIINVVNEIAFQTNLLALNAAVEAARAGEQGRGFAVVAVEVRNLAGRSAEAAKEIQSLINDSVEKIENGNDLVLKTGENLNKITKSMVKMSELISEISAASNEQSAGIEQVNNAIIQMDQVVQQNASLVEEAAASSQAMNSEADTLYNLTSEFKVNNNSTNNK